ncbi:MAG: hypothetical protein RL418_261, partial [Actinomycetota bacterium]
ELGVRDIQAVDLHPKHQLVTQGDFLRFEPIGKNLVTISNPPFGRNNALSVPFFNHAAKFSEYIGFLVPRSWRKWSVINRLHQSFHLVDDLNVQVNYVDESGNTFGERNDLRTCFQIWRKGEESRGQFRVQDQKLIEKAKPEAADIAVRVFGFGCGSVYRDFPRTPNTTLMFSKSFGSESF